MKKLSYNDLLEQINQVDNNNEEQFYKEYSNIVLNNIDVICKEAFDRRVKKRTPKKFNLKDSLNEFLDMFRIEFEII